MVRKNKVDFSELKALEKRFNNLNRKEADKLNGELVKAKASLFLGTVTRLTPVGQYDNGVVGGTLRRGWTTDSQKEAELSATFGASNQIKNFVDSNVKVVRKGKTYTIELKNNVEYASYVNYGHRTRGGTGFVNGQFFLEKAQHSTEKGAKKVLYPILIKKLKEVVEGDK